MSVSTDQAESQTQLQQRRIQRVKQGQGLQYQQETRQYLQCSKGCGGEIYFHPHQRTQSGRWIPLDRQTEKPHSCSSSMIV
jgi:hypothetical protein